MKKVTNNSLGQVTMEYILLAVVMIVLFQVATNTLRENQYLEKFQELPHQVFANLVENGNWKIDKVKSREHHPNHYDLHYSSNGM